MWETWLEVVVGFRGLARGGMYGEESFWGLIWEG